MKPADHQICTAFKNSRLLATGSMVDVALVAKSEFEKNPKAVVMVFDDSTGQFIEFDYRGSDEKFIQRLKGIVTSSNEEEIRTGPGRPKLGVISREIGLLPRHWDWLAQQPEGASAALRKLVEAAQKKNAVKDEVRRAQDATYKFMSIMGGDYAGYEEALRAFYAKDRSKFVKLLSEWPKDIRDHVLKLAKPVF